jgi:two-component system nitrate/nitrite response regulator NarL
MIGSMPVTVLLIDDDPSFRQLARRTLAGTRMAVVGEADTAAAGAQAARDLKPEVVLVDVGLPDSDGIALAHELSALPCRAQARSSRPRPRAAAGRLVGHEPACGGVRCSPCPSNFAL